FGLITTDTLGSVRTVNAEAHRLTGFDAYQAAGKDLGEVLHLLDENENRTAGEVFEPWSQMVNAMGGVRTVCAPTKLLQSRTGATFHVETCFSEIGQSGVTLGVAVSLREVS